MKPTGYKRVRGTRAANRMGGISARPAAQNAPEARFACPPDLSAFMASSSVSQIVQALGVGRGTANHLQHGRWPRDTRRILSAWQTYKGQAECQSGWFLRRVHELGVIRHASREWTSHDLDTHVGQTVAVARTADGLLAQTLEMPPKRLALALVPTGEAT